eukprot:jgi/Botrbrau1/3741/Bobra.0363s0020.1
MGPALPAVAGELARRLPLSEAVRAGADAATVRSHLSPAVAHMTNLISDYAKGSYIWATNGEKYLDMTGGIGVASTGHCHPRVVAAAQEQAGLLIHTQQNIFSTNVPMVGLIDRLLKVVPSPLQRFFFANSGSEAVDNAIKVARAHTKKQNVIAFENSFHGRTFGAMAVTNSKVYYRQGFGPLMGQSFAAAYPYCLHCPTRAADPSGGTWYKVAPNVPPVGEQYEARRCCGSPLQSLEWLFKQQSHPDETAAIIVEPILGEGGFLTPPPGFLDAVRAYCNKHNIVFIIDEVQGGVARTGKWWAHQHVMEGHPDIMIFAKGIASGYPFAGLAVKPHMFDGLALGTMGGTYGGNPLGCAIACATLDVIEEEGLLENAAKRGLQLQQGLVELAKRFPITDVRGRGLMSAIEFGAPDGSLTAPAGVATAVSRAALDRNMLLLTAGARETVRFLPPLTVSAAEINEALEKLEGSLVQVFGDI